MTDMTQLQQAIPPLRYVPENRRSATCNCREQIVTSCFGWVHTSNHWVRTSHCGEAKPA
jgi:hypothetical protein